MPLKKGVKAKRTEIDADLVTMPQAELERELRRVEAHRNQLWAELAEHTETMQERLARGAPIKRMLTQHEGMRERYCVVEDRRQDLLGRLPQERVTTNDDF